MCIIAHIFPDISYIPVLLGALATCRHSLVVLPLPRITGRRAGVAQLLKHGEGKAQGSCQWLLFQLGVSINGEIPKIDG